MGVVCVVYLSYTLNISFLLHEKINKQTRKLKLVTLRMIVWCKYFDFICLLRLLSIKTRKYWKKTKPMFPDVKSLVDPFIETRDH